jgi:hypothetical protein
MLKNNYFSHRYQYHFSKLKNDSLQEYIKLYERTYNNIKSNYPKYLNNLLSKESEISDTENNIEYNYNELETDSFRASSGYTSINSEEEREIESVSENKEFDVCSSPKPQETENMGVYQGILDDERFKNLKINKNQLTIKPRTREEIKEFQKQELDRYKNPHLPWAYTNSDGSVSVVAPVLKKMPTTSSSKPRDHVLLKPDRPSYVTILCLARDAASRLPDGVGTRADICDLLKDSQYTNERLSDSQVFI